MSQGRQKRIRRSRLSRFLEQFSLRAHRNREAEHRGSRGDRLKLETLERRQLLAGDIGSTTTDLPEPITTQAEVGLFLGSSVASEAVQSGLTVETAAEGEPAPDLVQFAQDLAAAGVVFYGADWCPACTEQKQLFGDGGDDLPFVEVTNPDRTLGQVGIDNNITAYPTWVFPDDSRETGVLTLQEISQRSGVAIPQSESPSFVEIGDQTVLIGSPLHIPVDAYDPNGGPLTVTVSVSNPNLLDASVITGNRSIRIDMETYGDMVFELFEQRAPVAAGRVIELAQAGFYDDIIFHRVIDNFVIQGGDPTGTGTSGSTLPDFDDDFHPDLQHNRKGVLSFAKSSDDTNNSQFFVTEVPTRFLDYNHSVFGQLIEGEDVRDAISEHAVNAADRPTTDITINTIEVFTDNENSLVMLKPTGNAIGSTDVTITVTDQDGNTSSETFQVDVNNDTANSQPFLDEVTLADSYPAGTPATQQLSSTDVEGDAVAYSALVISQGTGATAAISQDGLLTVTPADGYTGPVDVRVTVRPGAGVTGNSSSDSDNQVFRFNFEAEQTVETPTGVNLLSSSDTGVSDTDNITNADSLSFVVSGVTNGATVQLINTQTSAVIGEGISTGSTITITTNNIAALGDGTYDVAARQIVGSEVSANSSSITLTYDSAAPASVAGSALTTANVGRLYQSDLINAEEGSVTYELTQAPSGATINAGSGLIEWTPASGDVGSSSFTVTVTDTAGNVRTDTFNVDVAEAPRAEVKLVLKDLSGNEITELNVGEEFILEIIGVDARAALDRDGVYAIYTDILFDANIVRPVSGATIEYQSGFTLAPKGNFSTGLIDEVGAASTRTEASQEDESLIAQIRMETVGPGTVNIRSEAPDEATSEILLFGENNQIPAESVFFGSANLAVGIDFQLNDDTVSVAEDSGTTVIDVLDNDTASSNQTLSVISVEQPASGGTVSLDSGVVSFTPDADFNGTAVFTYRAGNGNGTQDTATVTVTVTSVNDDPVGNPDTYEVVADSTANVLDVLDNDSSGPDTGETLSVIAVTGNSSGAVVSVTQDGQGVSYTPAAGFTGTDTFTYTLSDGEAEQEVTVTVTVMSADDPPTAVDDDFTVNEDTAETSYDVLANDTPDVNNETFAIESVGTPDQGGAVRFSADGSSLFYRPAADFFGTETVTYTIRDSGGGLSTGLVTFTVSPVNDPAPVTSPTIPLPQGSSSTVVLNLDDLPDNIDGDSETLTLDVVGSPSAGGTAVINADGHIEYTPPSDTFVGTDTITYTVSDGSGADSTGTITIEVQNLSERSITVRFNNGQAGAAATGVRLVGTDSLGNAVELSAVPDDEFNLTFSQVLPGDYMVEIPAIPFFQGGDQPQQFSINAQPDDGDVVLDAQMGRLKARYLTLRDWLGSTPAQSVLVAVQPGSDALLTEPTPAAAESIVQPEFTLNEAGTRLTVSGTEPGDETTNLSAAVDLDRSDIAEPRGQIGDLYLYRVDVSDDVINYSTTTAPAASSEAEGESPSGLQANGGGEGEGFLTTPAEATGEEEEDSSALEVEAEDLQSDPNRLLRQFTGNAAAEAAESERQGNADESEDDAESPDGSDELGSGLES